MIGVYLIVCLINTELLINIRAHISGFYHYKFITVWIKMGFKARFMLFSWRVEYGVCESEDSWPPFPSANVNKDNM